MFNRTVSVSRPAALLLCCLAASGAAWGAQLKSLTVCADPGNMPLSNQKGEGFENKIAQLIGASLGTGVQYYWRPSIERGLMRTTLSEGNCDLWMDMASDTEGAEVLSSVPLNVCSGVSQRQGPQHPQSGRPHSEEAARGRIPGLCHPHGVGRAPRRRQHGDSLPEPQWRSCPGQPALVPGAASH